MLTTQTVTYGKLKMNYKLGGQITEITGLVMCPQFALP